MPTVAENKGDNDMADQVALMLDGRLIKVGAPDELFANPQDSRTLAFVHWDMVY